MTLPSEPYIFWRNILISLFV